MLAYSHCRTSCARFRVQRQLLPVLQRSGALLRPTLTSHNTPRAEHLHPQGNTAYLRSFGGCCQVYMSAVPRSDLPCQPLPSILLIATVSLTCSCRLRRSGCRDLAAITMLRQRCATPGCPGDAAVACQRASSRLSPEAHQAAARRPCMVQSLELRPRTTSRKATAPVSPGRASLKMSLIAAEV